MSILSSHHNWSQRIQEKNFRGTSKKVKGLGYLYVNWSPCFQSHQLITGSSRGANKCWQVFSTSGDEDLDPPEEDFGDRMIPEDGFAGVNNEILRENLERIVGSDDSTFSGIDLATLIRNKYGRSYDIQLIKKEFMGRNLLALNVMWKYLEQRSFPLTEEEYILRLDDVANTLKCWGAVSHIRNSLAKLKERPRIGKAVSIFIDMDESGGRANEWIYK
ncbi:hypothetical protein SAY87_005253 [Trapa incisa]|uniref:Uncharacterized protein n=1 Tax=Trapa incisa TaxID=236973 RepID=A0AAN7KC34_9MYRT|nr:hypothetical protein SAY87_005253 [Trapa incisa]